MTETKENAVNAPALETSFSGRTKKEGDIVSGTIVKVTDTVAFVDYGARSEGYLRVSELRDDTGALVLNEGDEIHATIISARGAVELSYKKAQAGQTLMALQNAWKEGRPVSGKIVAVNKGGYEVRVEGVRAFCPASQLSLHFVQEPAREVGETYDFKITEFSQGKKGLVVSRRALLEGKREEMKAVLGEKIRVGDHLQGKVTEIREFGAFIDLGDGLEGLLHVSEISHEHVNHPSEKLNVGDAVEIQVIRIETEKVRVALSMKSLVADPWTTFFEDNEVGTALKGTVMRLESFGAFVKLAPGIEGLLHISAISADKRLNHAEDALSSGEEIDLIIEKIDRNKRRIGLMTPEVAEARKPVEITAKVGEVVKGPVTRVEKFGVFIQVEPKVEGVIPNGEMMTDRGADHRKLFPLGTEIEAKITEIDARRGRVRLSRKAVAEEDERQAMDAFRKANSAPGSLGSFGDLLKDFLKTE